MKKTVSYPIEVRDGKYCWGWNYPYGTCRKFNNEGGIPNCSLGFTLDWTDAKGLLSNYPEDDSVPQGILKSKECLKLKEVK